MQDEDIVHAASNSWKKYDVGSSHPGGGEASKGRAVRPLKRHASWVQTDVSQVGLYPVWASESWGNWPSVREDQGEVISGAPVVLPRAPLGSYITI